MKPTIQVEDVELDLHEHAIDCAEAWQEATGENFKFCGDWELQHKDGSVSIFSDAELIEVWAELA